MLPVSAHGGDTVTVGFRANHVHVDPRPGSTAVPGEVELAELSGSDTFVYARTPIGEVVAQLTGVHRFGLGERIRLYFDPGQTYAFDAAGDLLAAPVYHPLPSVYRPQQAEAN